jgi:hypothetical protein
LHRKGAQAPGVWVEGTHAAHAYRVCAVAEARVEADAHDELLADMHTAHAHRGGRT